MISWNVDGVMTARPKAFEKVLHGSDPEASVPASDQLTGLRGKDVIVAFVESYGRVAVEDSWFAPQIDRTLTLTGLPAHLAP